jgi:hypothetical protein
MALFPANACQLNSSFAGNKQVRFAGFIVANLDVEPVDAVAQSRAKGFQERLLGSKAQGKVLVGKLPGKAVIKFTLGKQPPEKRLVILLHKPFKTGNFSYVNASADNHCNASPLFVRLDYTVLAFKGNHQEIRCQRKTLTVDNLQA